MRRCRPYRLQAGSDFQTLSVRLGAARYLKLKALRHPTLQSPATKLKPEMQPLNPENLLENETPKAPTVP